MQYKLSFLIPARNEEFLSRTIQDILEHTSEQTEIIVVLDGKWADPPIIDNPRVNLIYVPESIGQRAATNLACKMSKAKYVAKIDAHCSLDKDWDLKMFEAFEQVGDNVTMVSTMRNLWIYDWKCYKCGCRTYQDKGNTCPDCGNEMKKKMLWIAKERPQSNSYCFDSTPHFQYWNEYTKRPEYKEALEKTGLTETMSLQGSCWMLTREKYLEFAVGREELGSWGQEGLEIACKTWLSGGRVIINHKTWYSHCFRTKGEVFGFPYPQPGSEVSRTKKKVWDFFFSGWDKQIHPMSWLVKKFWPVNGWTEQDLNKING